MGKSSDLLNAADGPQGSGGEFYWSLEKLIREDRVHRWHLPQRPSVSRVLIDTHGCVRSQGPHGKADSHSYGPRRIREWKGTWEYDPGEILLITADSSNVGQKQKRKPKLP